MYEVNAVPLPSETGFGQTVRNLDDSYFLLILSEACQRFEREYIKETSPRKQSETMQHCTEGCRQDPKEDTNTGMEEDYEKKLSKKCTKKPIVRIKVKGNDTNLSRSHCGLQRG